MVDKIKSFTTKCLNQNYKQPRKTELENSANQK